MNRHIKKTFSIFKYRKKEMNILLNLIDNVKNTEYLTFYNPECIGIMNSTKELFDESNIISLYELFNKKEIEKIALKIKEQNFKQVIFSTMAYGYKPLAEKIHEVDNTIKIKFLWHGSHSLFVNKNEEYFLYNILDLAKRNIIESIGFLKESMADFYKSKGYNAYFVKNTVNTKAIEVSKKEKDNKIRIGLYSSGDRWEKNTYNQLSACAMLKNAIVDLVPNTDLSKSFCKLMNIEMAVDSNISNFSHDDLLIRMSNNDINLYVTFTECAPLVPLESFEVGVPCIVGDNNHYFNGTELEEFLVVKSEDSIDEIYEKINLVIKNKEKIITLYKNWKKTYDVEAKKSVEEFLKS